jgi:superfamily II DNA or RNA helicase
MDKQKRAKCPNGTRKFKPLGDGCYTDEQIENHKKTKKRKEEPMVLKTPVSKPSSQNKSKKKKQDVNEEPVFEEPVFEEPVFEEPVFEEPVNEEPVFEEPVFEEPVFEEPVNEEPVFEEPVNEEPVNEEPKEGDDFYEEEEEDQDLKEKEEKEYNDNLKTVEETNFLHPHLGNPYFSKQISLRKEFEKLKYDGEIKDVKELSNIICANPEFELLPHQLFVKGFMSDTTPYKSILLYHGLGSGKTCSAMGISEEIRKTAKQTGSQPRIFVIASPNVKENFKQQLFDKSKLVKTDGIWSLNTCVGKNILNEINPTNAEISEDTIISHANAIIKNDYKFKGYDSFANYIEEKIKIGEGECSLAEQELVKKHFDNSLIIIDEVHNCTKEGKTLTKPLKKLVKYANNLRLILLSATPMYNSPKEIIWITNLMNLNDRRPTIKYSDVFDEEGNLINKDLLRRKLTGYVSYVRGENPYTFPFRVYPSPSKQKFTAINSGERVDVPLQGKIYLTEIGDMQKKVYDLVIRKSLNQGDGLFVVNNAADLENMEKYGYSKLQAPLQSLIVTFWHEDFERIVNDEDDGIKYKELYGQTGLDHIMKYVKDNTKNLKYNYEYKPGVPHIFSQELLPRYSAKITKVCDCIRASANRIVEIDNVKKTIHGGIIIVYTQYIYGGIVPMALALEEMGFLRYGENESLFKKGVIEKRIDANTMEEYSKDEIPKGGSFKQARYMIISGDKYFSQNNAEDIKVVTNKDNKYGEQVRVILISRAASEGLDFKNIRQVHVLDPWYNLNRNEQIIGRGVRNRSHCSLEFEERNVEIYMHATTNGERETADTYVYRYAEEKAKKIGTVTRLMKEISVDCVLNHSQSNFTDEGLETIAKNQNIKIVPSTKNKAVRYKIGDKPFSEICDYMDNCEYKCYPEDADEKIKVKHNEMYNEEQISINSNIIIDKIKNLFKRENAYHIDELKGIFKNTTKEELYYALTLLIEGPELIMDMHKRMGKLVNYGDYYVFKPQEITSPNISLYESTFPIKTMHERVKYEIDTNDENMKSPVEDEQYNILIESINNKLRIATKDEPNELIESSEKYDWYYNINSVYCKKNTKEFVKFKKDNKIANGETDAEIEIKLDEQRYAQFLLLQKNAVCDTTTFKTVMTRLRFLGFNDPNMKKYVMAHILDTLSHEDKLILAKRVFSNGFSPSNYTETHINEYFNYLLLDEKVLVLAKDGENVFYRISNWSILTFGERQLMHDKINEKLYVDPLDFSNIIGFVAELSDDEKSMVFKRKDMTQKKNNWGAYLQNDNGKMPIIKKVNEILGMAGSPYCFDDEKCPEPTRNTDDISKIAFAGIFELLIRKMNYENVSGKKWFLRPEIAIYNKISNPAKV